MAADPNLPHVSMPIHIPVSNSTEAIHYLEFSSRAESMKQRCGKVIQKLHHQAERIQWKMDNIEHEIKHTLHSFFAQRRDSLLGQVQEYEAALTELQEQFEAQKSGSQQDTPARRMLSTSNFDEQDIERLIDLKVEETDASNDLLEQISRLYDVQLQINIDSRNTYLAYIPSDHMQVVTFDCIKKQPNASQADLPAAITAGAAWWIIDNTEVFVSGGRNDDIWLRRAFSYSINESRIETHNYMILARGFHAICYLNSACWVFGGCIPSYLEQVSGIELEGSSLDDAEFYNPSMEVWQSIQTLPEPLSYVTSEVLNGKIYLTAYATSFIYWYCPQQAVYSKVNINMVPSVYKNIGRYQGNLFCLMGDVIVFFSVDGSVANSLTGQMVSWANSSSIEVKDSIIYQDMHGAIYEIDVNQEGKINKLL